MRVFPFLIPPDHTTWNPLNDSNPTEPGWQSLTQNVDAVAAPDSCIGEVKANAGGDQEGRLGSRLCFNGALSTSSQGIATIGWDTTGDNTIDVRMPKFASFVTPLRKEDSRSM